MRETIDEAIRTYKREVEKMTEKVEQLEGNYMEVCSCGRKYEEATVTSATIVGMLIVCWAIYTVYTGESCNL